MIELQIEFARGSAGLQAQLAKQGVYPKPESVDVLARAEGDRAAISRLFCMGYFNEQTARGYVARLLTLLFYFPFDMSAAKKTPLKGGKQ